MHHTYGDKNKPALLFLHGFIGEALDFEAYAKELSSDYYCICMDLPGSGVNKLDPENPPSFDLIADQVRDLLNQLEIEQVTLIGYSLGARTGLFTYLKYPDFFNALVLESVNPGIENPSDREARIEKDQELADLMINKGMNEFLKLWYDLPLFQCLGDHRAVLEERAQLLDPQVVAQVITALSAGRMPNMYPQLNQVTCPVLILSGEKDQVFHERCLEAAKYIPKSDHSIFPDASHNIHLEQPEKYLQVVRKFLSNLT